MPDANVVSMNEAARRLGLTPQAVGMLANQCPPDCLSVVKGGKKGLIWPHFPVWLRQHWQRERKAPSTLDESRRRKLDAEAELAELEVAQRRGDLIDMAEAEKVYVRVLSRLRTTILNLPGRFASRTVGLESLMQSQVVWDKAMIEALKILSHDDLDGAEQTA